MVRFIFIYNGKVLTLAYISLVQLLSNGFKTGSDFYFFFSFINRYHFF